MLLGEWVEGSSRDLSGRDIEMILPPADEVSGWEKGQL
jgi:hypothetical protein